MADRDAVGLMLLPESKFDITEESKNMIFRIQWYRGDF